MLALVDETSATCGVSWASDLIELFIGVLSYVVKIIRHIFTRKWAVVSIVKLVPLVRYFLTLWGVGENYRGMRQSRMRKVTRASAPLPCFEPMMSLEEAWIIETASRMRGETPVQFMKGAGLALALTLLDGGSATSASSSTCPNSRLTPLPRPRGERACG